MLAQSEPIIPPAPKVHDKDLPTWRLLLEFTRNSVSTLPNYAFDVLVSRRRVLGIDTLMMSDPDGVRHVLATAMAKYKRLVSTRCAWQGSAAMVYSWPRVRSGGAAPHAGALHASKRRHALPNFVEAATDLVDRLEGMTRANLSF